MKLVFLILVALPLQVASAAPIDDAKSAFADGQAAFERGEYETALTYFLRADAIQPAPKLTYNIGVALEHLGRYGEAGERFSHYFEQAGPPENSEEQQFQTNLRARMESCRRRQLPRTEMRPRGAPQPPMGQVPADNYYPIAPNGYYVQSGNWRNYQLRQAQAQHKRAVALLAVGLTLTGLGVIITGVGAGVPHGRSYEDKNFWEIFVGVSFTVVGITLWAPGASSYVRSSQRIQEFSSPVIGPPAPLGQSFIFHSPVFRF